MHSYDIGRSLAFWLLHDSKVHNLSILASVGYRPFVEACIEADEKGEALKYIPKLADPRERAEVF